MNANPFTPAARAIAMAPCEAARLGRGKTMHAVTAAEAADLVVGDVLWVEDPHAVGEGAARFARTRHLLEVTAIRTLRAGTLDDADAEALGAFERSAVGDDPGADGWQYGSQAWRHATPARAVAAAFAARGLGPRAVVALVSFRPRPRRDDDAERLVFEGAAA